MSHTPSFWRFWLLVRLMWLIKSLTDANIHMNNILLLCDRIACSRHAAEWSHTDIPGMTSSFFLFNGLIFCGLIFCFFYLILVRINRILCQQAVQPTSWHYIRSNCHSIVLGQRLFHPNAKDGHTYASRRSIIGWRFSQENTRQGMVSRR